MKALSFLVSTVAFVGGMTSMVQVAHAEGPVCPAYLQNAQSSHIGNQSLCDLYIRYQKAVWSLTAQGIDVERIADLRAPRFINLPDWEKNKARVNYQPWRVYNPAPQTWQGWEDGVDYIDKDADYRAYTHVAPVLSIDWLRGVHAAVMSNLLQNRGQLRTNQNTAPNLLAAVGYTQAQVMEVTHPSGFSSAARPGQPLLTWRPVQCYNERPPEFHAMIEERRTRLPNDWIKLSEWPEVTADTYSARPDGVRVQCGIALYPKPEEVQIELQAFVDSINASLHASSGVDPVLIASRAQRWLVIIHPFNDGNGRLTRFVMDWILKGLGLPAPILKNMNDDETSNENAWADQVGQGLVRATEIAEHCANDTHARGCNMVTPTP